MRFTWLSAALRSVLIVLYFAIATVWLPHFILNLGAVAEASSTVRDAILVVVWGAALVAGLWGLRHAQSRGLI